LSKKANSNAFNRRGSQRQLQIFLSAFAALRERINLILKLARKMEIDLRKIILQKASAGASFEQLSDQYTMDGNTTHGDTGWFFGEEMMPKEFQDAVKNHKTGDIFPVDVAEKQWHYIVKKTYDDDDKKEMTVLRANGR